MDLKTRRSIVKLLKFWITQILLLSRSEGWHCSAFPPKLLLLRRECSSTSSIVYTSSTNSGASASGFMRGSYNKNRPAMKELRMRRGNNYKNNKKLEQDWNNIFSEDSNNSNNYQKKRKSDKIQFETGMNIQAEDVSHPDRTGNRKPDDTSDENFQVENQSNLRKTLPGGQSLLFEMARKLFVWEFNDDQEYDGKSLRKSPRQRDSEGNILLPRWRPYKGVSNDNVEFRSSSPRMTTEGYARAILRHARKRNPSMWKHALRIYEKTVELERQFSDQQTDQGNNLSINSINNTTTMAPITASTSGGFARTTIHYVGALIACSKLGFWKQAFKIFNDAQNNPSIQITEGMVLSLLRACVRASCSNKIDGGNNQEKKTIRRAPLDAAKELLLKLEVRETFIPYNSFDTSRNAFVFSPFLHQLLINCPLE